MAGKKIRLVIRLINKMFIYSAIKISAKMPLLYSVLKPETSSDSPSAKSKGARFVSARAVMNQIIMFGSNKITKGVSVSLVIFAMFREENKMIGLSKIKIILTSYEIVWAIPRIAPNKAYFELEDHPAAKVV